MCGIYGILGLDGPATTDPGVLVPMSETVVHRGPDDRGIYVDERLRLGMRRLAIIDVAGSHQPIRNEDGSLVVVCNGEIYNFRELRRELERKGHRFATHGDTEAIVHLYEEEGEACLRRLEGMFGLALWDRRRQRLIVARDPLGIKPIYYGVRHGELVFASEAKSLLALPGFVRRIHQTALLQYLSVGYVGGPQSMFEGILKLPPGHALIAKDGRFEQRRFWKLPDGVDERRSEADWIEATREAITRAVRAQMVSDVPIGALLSGGIDSSAVVAAMARASDRPVRTYAIGFKGSTGAELYNELPYARTVADTFGTTHREIIVQPNVAGLLPELIWHLDEPLADAAFLTTYLISKLAREDVTVILSGVGGDELFGGYKRYLDAHYRSRYRRIPRSLRRGVIAPIARWLPSDRHTRVLNALRLVKAFVLADSMEPDDRYRSFVQIFETEACERLLRSDGGVFDDNIARALAETTAQDVLRRLMDVDLATQLPEDLLALTDRMSMAVSLECRVPLLDRGLVELAARMPARFKIAGGELKHVLRQSLRGVLPDSILQREKRGFGAPIGAWFRAELAPLVRDILSPESVERRGLLRAEQVSAVVREHALQQSDRTDHLLALVNLEIWCRVYLDGQSPAAVAEHLRESITA